MHDPSGPNRASDISAGVAINAMNNPEGNRWSCIGDSVEMNKGAAGVGADAAGAVREISEDEVAAADGLRWALKENPNEIG